MLRSFIWSSLVAPSRRSREAKRSGSSSRKREPAVEKTLGKTTLAVWNFRVLLAGMPVEASTSLKALTRTSTFMSQLRVLIFWITLSAMGSVGGATFIGLRLRSPERCGGLEGSLSLRLMAGRIWASEDWVIAKGRPAMMATSARRRAG